MRKIPEHLRNELSEDLYYSRCARENKECSGRITWEHAIIYAGRQINEHWAIIPLCWYHHLGKGLDKRANRKIAVSRATISDLQRYPRMNSIL